MTVSETVNISGLALEFAYGGIPKESAHRIAGYIVQLEHNIATLEARVKDLESAARNAGPHLTHVEKRVTPAPTRP